MKTVHVESGAYYDSVHLMRVSAQVEAFENVHRALVAMATEANLDLARTLGFEIPTGINADEMIVALDYEDGAEVNAPIDHVRAVMKHRGSASDDGFRPKTVDAAIREHDDAQLVVVSVAGIFAAREAEVALGRGRHVMIFSDNVSVVDEVRLKQKGAADGLLVMGHDCGTAIINGVPLCFANHVRRGSIGVVAASGTGLQEVTSRIHNLGHGVSQALGTGGRDLKLNDAPGITMRMGLRALDADEDTRVLVLISKPPSDVVVRSLMRELETVSKPVVMHFVGGIPVGTAVPEGVLIASTLAEAAERAVETDRRTGSAHSSQTIGTMPADRSVGVDEANARQQQVQAAKQKLAPGRTFLRGLFCGGTLADELIAISAPQLGAVCSVGGSAWGTALANPQVSEGHTVVDLGEDVFTEGRPHPMIDPTIRLDRLVREATDPATAVIVIDFVLGTGSHADPIGVTIPAIESARAVTGAGGPVWIASIVGTDADPQDRTAARTSLEAAGVIVADSNAEAAVLATMVPPLEDNEGAQLVDEAVTQSANAGGHETVLSAFSRPLFGPSLSVVNVGIADFAADLRIAGAHVVDVDWRPPAGGNARMADILKKLGR
jgi:FdrA protein